MNTTLTSKRGLIRLLVIVVALYLVGQRLFTIVPPGHRGVPIILGQVQKESLNPGFHLVNPLASVQFVDVRVKRFDVNGDAASKDLQRIITSITLNYRINPDLITTLYNMIGPDFERTIIEPAVLESFKSISAGFSVDELITRREEVRIRIKDLLSDKINSRGQNALYVDELSITNFSYSDSFNAAIEAKLEAEQMVLKARKDLERVQIEGQQKLAQAGAEAESLRVQRAEITPDLLRLREIEVLSRFVEKWNGTPPTTLSFGSLPVFDLAKAGASPKP